MEQSKRTMWVLSFFLTVAIFVVFFIVMPIESIGAIIRGADVRFVAAAGALSIVSNLIIAAEQWRVLLRGLGCVISFPESLLLKAGIAPLKGILPLKSGELMRLIYLKKYYGFSFSRGAVSVLVAVLQGVTALLILMTLGYSIFFPQIVLNAAQKAALGTGILVLVSAVVVRRKDIMRAGRAIFLRRYGPEQQKDPGTFPPLHHLLPSFGYAFIIEALEIFIFYLSFRAISLSVPLADMLRFVPLVILAANMPVTMFGLGIRETAIVLYLSHLFPPGALLSGGLLFSFVISIVPALGGFLFVRRLVARVAQ